MPQDTKGPVPLSVHHAFVVHFRVDSKVAPGQVAGRVEHVVAGQATHFASLEELLASIAQVLATVRAPPHRKPQRSREGSRHKSLKSDGCKANEQRQVPSMAVSIQRGDKVLDTKNDAQTAQPAYNREVTTPTDSPGGPSACVYPVYHSASPMR